MVWSRESTPDHLYLFGTTHPPQTVHPPRLASSKGPWARLPKLHTIDLPCPQSREDAIPVVAGTRHPLNMFNTAARLPLDLPVTISSFLYTKDLFPTSQVCRRWRTILVSSPALWTKIHCQDLTWTIGSLGRHQPVLLQLDLYDGPSTEALDAALDHGSKVSSICAHLSLDQLLEFHRSPVTPFMEDLVLFVDEDDDHYQEERDTIDL